MWLAALALRGRVYLPELSPARSVKRRAFPGVATRLRWTLRVLVAIVSVLLSFQTAEAQQIRLAARARDTHPAGAADWDALFRSSPEWTAVASRINVFGMTVGYLLKVTDQELVATTADPKQRHIALSIALQSIARTAADRGPKHKAQA
jgi:hypothetical protein